MEKNDKALDTVSTDTTGSIKPVDHEGNAYLQLIVDLATDHTQGFTIKKKRSSEIYSQGD